MRDLDLNAAVIEKIFAHGLTVVPTRLATN
jgi:hypothetical protein